jgi:hypothetical protein
MEPLTRAEEREHSHIYDECTDNGCKHSSTGASTRTTPEELKAAGEVQAATPGATVAGEGLFSCSTRRCLPMLDSSNPQTGC